MEYKFRIANILNVSNFWPHLSKCFFKTCDILPA